MIHRSTCPLAAPGSDRWDACSCRPGYRATVLDAKTNTRRTKTFPTPTAAACWREDQIAGLRSGALRLLPAVTMEELWSRWYGLAESGAERATGGGEFRPSVLRAYRGAWERLSPRIGQMKAHELRTPPRAGHHR